MTIKDIEVAITQLPREELSELAAWFEEFLRRRVDTLFDSVDQLAALDLPPLSEAEVQTEIAVAREARRGYDASGIQ